MSLAGAFADARKSATRMYINNFADKGRQNTIDMLLVCNLLYDIELSSTVEVYFIQSCFVISIDG